MWCPDEWGSWTEWKRNSAVCDRQHARLGIPASFPLPANAVFGVFDQNTFSLKGVANLVGASKITRLPRLQSLFDIGFYFGIGKQWGFRTPTRKACFSRL